MHTHMHTHMHTRMHTHHIALHYFYCCTSGHRDVDTEIVMQREIEINKEIDIEIADSKF